MSGLGVLFSPRVNHALAARGDQVPLIIEGEITAVVCSLDNLPHVTAEPQKLLGLIQEYFAEVERIVFEHEGTLEKHTPSSYLAVWGAPFRQRDGAERALQTGVELQSAVHQLGLDWRRRGYPEPALHIGISSGPAVMGRVGDPPHVLLTTVGAALDQATKLSSIAGANEIVIAEATYSRLPDLQLDTRRLPPLRWRKGEEPIDLYSVLWRQPDQAVTEKTPPATKMPSLVRRRVP